MLMICKFRSFQVMVGLRDLIALSFGMVSKITLKYKHAMRKSTAVQNLRGKV
jgi:hypothetical protein